MKRYKLGDLIEVTRGASLAGQYYASEGSLIRLTLGNFDYSHGGFKNNTSKNNLFYIGEVKPEYILNKGDIITPLTEQTPGLLGTTARIPESGKYIQSQDVALIRCKEGQIDPSYCFYLISSESVKKQLGAAAQQTKIRHTSPDRIKEVIVDIPSLEEQRAIGRFLDILTEKIENAKAINDYLEAMARQLYDYWFVQYDFPNENGKPYRSSGGKMVWNEKLRREIPAIWGIDSIGSKKIYNSDYTANGSFASLAENVRYNDGEPYALLVRIVDLNGEFFEDGNFVYLNKHGYNFLKSCSLQGDEIIICNVGNAGATYRCPRLGCPMSLGPNGIVINDPLYNHFLYEYFKSPIGQHQIRTISSGSIQMKFNKTNFRELPIPFPDNRVIHLFNEVYGKLFEEKNLIWAERKELTRIKNKLLPSLMNGQVSVKPLNNHLSAV